MNALSPTAMLMPMAAMVPRIVDTAAAKRAMDTVTYSASMMEGLLASSRYQRRENPSHFARLMPALKDWKISTAMGR